MSSEKIRKLAAARSKATVGAGPAKILSLAEIESVFVTKLSEKYDFTERGTSKISEADSNIE